MPKLIDLTGRIFGRWLVISRAPTSANKTTVWNCACLCGNHKIVLGAKLRNGESKSCGCLRSQLTAERERINLTTHGMRFTRTYKSYDSMKQRCNNPNNKDYRYYGGKGVIVCNRWLESFMNFFEDMGERPQGMSIDRLDNSEHYCKENCKWSDKYEQSNNRKGITCVEIGGVKKTISQWQKISGVSRSTILKRINAGITGHEIIRESSKKNIQIPFNGVAHTTIEWSKITGIAPNTLNYRLKHGWTVNDALNAPVA